MRNNKNYSTVVKVLALCKFARIKPRVYAALMHQFKNLDNILDADKNALKKIIGVDSDTSDSITIGKLYLDKAEKYYQELIDRDIKVITSFDADYPSPLTELNDPPPLLYWRGEMPDNKKKSITLIGTTEATNEGIELTINLAKIFVDADVQVVSSLNKGIDASVHLGCKSAEGASYALLDTGFDSIDSSEQMPLAIDIAQDGGVITEYPPEQKKDSANLQESNRLLVGLTNAVIITQYYKNSKRILDILSFCNQIGNMVFLLVDPEHGALSDKEALDIGNQNGLIPIAGFDQVDNIINALV